MIWKRAPASPARNFQQARRSTRFLAFASFLVIAALAAGAGQAQSDCPAPDGGPPAADRIARTAERLTRPVMQRVRSGGPVDLRRCDQLPGRGFITERPILSLDFSATPPDPDLVFRTQGDCEPFLLIRDPEAEWHRSDGVASRTTPTQIALRGPGSGRYDIWVGNRHGDCRVTLSMLSRAAQRLQRADRHCLDARAVSNQIHRLPMLPMRRSHELRVNAGGQIDLSRCALIQSSARVQPEPALTFEIPMAVPSDSLVLSVEGRCRPAVIVNDPAGQWYASDSHRGGTDTQLPLNRLRQGLYRVWIGSSQRTGCQATLRIADGR